MSYEYIATNGSPIKAWTKGVLFEEEAKEQVQRLAQMPFIYKHVAVMPDVHKGVGSTIGSVIATKGAIIPAAVGADIGCGIYAQKTNLKASNLPDSLAALRSSLEQAIPHGRTDNGGDNDRGAWGEAPAHVLSAWARLEPMWELIVQKHPRLTKSRTTKHLGTLGTGNHFVEVCIDEQQNVWVMLHSGSRGVGNAVGMHFIGLAKQDMQRYFINLPDGDLAYLPEGSDNYRDYLLAVDWAQRYAMTNRSLMMKSAFAAIQKHIPHVVMDEISAINCHHNYVESERHFGKDVMVTRKGAVNAMAGRLGVIPGSMGTKSYIVEGLGNSESFCSCSHGAGRRMSRTAARAKFTVEDHIVATSGVECRKDSEVVDETPAAYKDIDAVMEAQKDLVTIRHTLKQVLCVKG